MRKTLSEALKWYKEKTALEAVNSEKIIENVQIKNTTGVIKWDMKTVTITIVDCKRLDSRLSKNPTPFFYY